MSKEDKTTSKNKKVKKNNKIINEEPKDKKKDLQVRDVQRDAKAENKKEKKKRFFEELRSFFILLVVILAVVFGVWYWYTNVYDKKDNIPAKKEENVVNQYKSYKYTVASNHKLDVLNDKYVIEYDDDYIYKVMDVKTNVLFEGEEEFDFYIEGSDGNIYIVLDSEADTENIVNIYKLDNKKFTEVKELFVENVYFVPIQYEEIKGSGNYITLGFTGTRYSYDTELNEENTTFVYSLDGDEYELDNYQLIGDTKGNNSYESIVTYNKDKIIFYVSETYSDKSYGLLKLSDGEVIIKPQYDGLYTNGSNYIAVKDGKAGIITDKLKKIVNFDYDFIADYGTYYVVSKNNKMAIMDEKYNLVTDFVFDYQASSNNVSYVYNGVNTFDSYKINDKYILSINNLELDNNLQYDKSETYIINKNGKYTTIEANKFFVNSSSGLIYAYSNSSRVVTLFDSELNELYKINLNNYDFSGLPKVKLINGNTLEIKLDSSIYYDYETGEEINDIKDFSALINDITINYDKKNKKLIYSSDDKEIANIDVDIDDIDNMNFIELNEKEFYYATDSQFLYIGKNDE